MFTGIIESVGEIREITETGTNKTFWISSSISDKLKPDQSVSHNGVCLTVEEIGQHAHRVTAIAETLKKTTLGSWIPGMRVNLERCLQVNDRIDGHFVQGHVDATGKCLGVKNLDGSWELEFEFPEEFAALVIEKGSIAVNGTSLTAFNIKKNGFTVAIVPFTWENSTMKNIKEGDKVNLEFDLLGKYLLRKLSLTI